jgi:L-threonylcarbamoyladenylate synthase
VILPFQSEAEITAAIPQVKRHLSADKLLAYPTETVYGLGSAPTAAAVASLARIKGRPQGKPFLLLISGRRMAEEWGLVFSPSATALSEAFWPGPLTLVLRGGEGRLPDELRGREGGIAVRYTSHAGIARLIASLGEPLTSTSANRPGGQPAPGADKLVELFGPEERNGELLVLDGGVLGNVPSSTLVDCTDIMPRMIREGAIPRAELRRAAGRLSP